MTKLRAKAFLTALWLEYRKAQILRNHEKIAEIARPDRQLW